MGYKFYSDIKEEQEEECKYQIIRNLFRFSKNYSGPININSKNYITHGVIVNGYPHGLIIIKFKETKNKLHAFFHNGLPQGEWILYDNKNKILKTKKVQKGVDLFE